MDLIPMGRQEQERQALAMFRQFWQVALVVPDRADSWPTGDKASTQPTVTYPRTISGYFLSRQEMQLAKAESLAG